MRAVLDTNIFISGIHWSGISSKILEAWFDDKFELITSEPILEELTRILKGFKKPFTDEQILDWISTIGAKAEVVRPSRKIEVVKVDPDDDKFIEAAVEGGADYIVSQDRHLLNLKEFEGVKIVRPEEFVKLFVSED